MAEKKNKKLNKLSSGEAEILARQLLQNGHGLSKRFDQLLKVHPDLVPKVALMKAGKA